MPSATSIFWRILVLALALAGFLPASASAQTIAYPAGAGLVLDVTSYGAVGDNNPASAAANTAAFQAALIATRPGGAHAGKILYIPHGTYYLNDTITGGTSGLQATRMHLQGQSRAGTVLRLVDSAPGFGNASSPRSVIRLLDAEAANDTFQNFVSNLTIDVGSNNPGAVALDFHTNNGGGVINVLLRGPATAHTGLAITRRLAGIGLLRHLRIEGFRTGAHIAHFHVAFVFDACEFVGQSEVAVLNHDKPLSFFDCVSENSVPFLRTLSPGAQIVVVDSLLLGGSASQPAIDNATGAQVFLRNNTVTGYAHAYADGANTVSNADAAGEFVSHGVLSLDPATPLRSLDIPVAPVPAIDWDTPTGFVLYDDPANIPAAPITDPGVWAVVDGSRLNASGGWIDDTALLQAALNSGARTVAFAPRKTIDLTGTVTVGGNVRRILGLGAEVVARHPLNQSAGLPMFRFVNGNHPVVSLEGIDNGNLWSNRTCVLVSNERSGDLVLNNIQSQFMPFYRHTASATGRVFFVNSFVNPVFLGANGGESPVIRLDGQTAHALQLNAELLGSSKSMTHSLAPFVLNNGGVLTLRGFKFGEEHGPYLHTQNGGFTEVLGGVVNVTDLGGADAGQYPFSQDDARVAYVAVERKRDSSGNYPPHTIVLRETRDGVTTDLLPSDTPLRLGGAPGGFTLPLYVSYDRLTGSTAHGTAASGRIRSDNLLTTDATSNSLSVGKTSDSPNRSWLSVLEFYLSGLEDEIAFAETVQLHLTVSQRHGWTGAGRVIVSAHDADGDGAVTLADASASVTELTSLDGAPMTVGQRVVFDITAAAKAASAAGRGYLALRLSSDLADAPTSDQVVFFSSHATVPAASRPVLVLINGALPPPPPPPAPVLLAAHNGTASSGDWLADSSIVSGTSLGNGGTSNAINLSGVTDPAPEAIYQTHRHGNPFAYTFTGLDPLAEHTVRLHFCETWANGANKRRFHVEINGARVLTNLDVFQVAGGQFRAHAETFTATADANGVIMIDFLVGSKNRPFVSGVELWK
jgi:hypothetical protein